MASPLEICELVEQLT